jgi:hypothetical protein
MVKKGVDKHKSIKIGKIKVSSNWKILFLIIALIIILVVILLILLNYNKDKSSYECINDKDCSKISTMCCPCNSGGIEKCVSLTEKNKIMDELNYCKDNMVCPEVNNCYISSCKCINNECVGK